MELDFLTALQFASGASSGSCADGPKVSRRKEISIYFEINLHKSWMKLIDAECEEYGMDRMYFVKELVKLGLVAWKAEEDGMETLLGD